MKITLSSALAIAALAAAPMLGQAQTYSFPGTASPTGAASPPSTLRITETPQPGAPAPAAAPAPIRDTPESVAEYQRCRRVSDRAAVDRHQMEAGVAQCLRELQARRQAR